MKITGRSIKWEGKFIRTVLLDYTDRRGVKRQWETVERKNTDGVVIIAAITPDRKAILIRQWRPALNEYVIELPAGLIEPGESAHSACRRELIEETGFYSDNISLLSRGAISTGILTEDWHAMLAQNSIEATQEQLATFPPDETEDIEVMSIDLDSAYDELSTMEAAGNRVDIRIYGLIELARRQLSDRTEA